MKKNKLYKVNKWNQPAFMVDRMHHNIFDGFSGSTLVRPDMFEYQGSYQSPAVQLAGSSVATLGRNAGNEFSRSLLNNKPATIDNAPQVVAPKESGSKSSGFDTSAMMSFGLGSIPTTPIEYNGTTYRRGAWDLLDPTYQLSGAKSSEAGDILSDMGVAATKTGNPWAMMTGSVLKQAGSVVNALWGSELHEDNIKRVEDEITGMNRQANVLSGSENNEEYIRNSQGMNAGWNFTQGDIGEDGLFAHKAEDTYNDLKRRQALGRTALRTGIVLGARSADRNIDDAAKRNFVYAYGGPLGQYNGDDMGAIEYGFMTDYLTQKKRENDMKSKMSGIVPVPAFMPNSFAIGGDLQTNGADWSNGLITIGAGGQHETNPNEGVQLGVDNENIPNLVEEGETVYENYVFSNRILADEATKQMFRLPKKKDITFADISKKLEKEIAERPSDPISKAGFEKQMQMLEEQQERQKQEMEAERAKAAFEALSPEEQTALMQQKAEQEAIAQQQTIAEQQAAMQQPTPEELAIAQQQQQMADGSGAALGQEPQMAANGGKLFAPGGYLWDKFWSPVNEYSKKKGNTKGKYQIDKEWKGNIKELEDSETYKAFTDYILNKATDEERMKYFQWIDANTGRDNKYITDGKLADNWKNMYQAARTDGLYGIQHYTPELQPAEATTDPSVLTPPSPNPTPRVFHAMVDDDDYIQGELDPKVVGAEVRRETLPNGDIVIYHDRMKSTGDVDNGNGNKDIVPDLKKETYFGLFGPAVGLGLMGLGVGKPDVASYDAAVSGAGNYTTANWKPLGNYLTYRPLDIWYEQNALNAQSRATDRALVNNSGGNRGTAMAGLLANGYNSQLASGNLFRQAQEYNDNLRKQVADFNRGTDQFNSEQYGATSRFNASAYNDANRASAQMKLNAAQAKDDANRWWASNLYGNINGLFDNINQWEKWKRDHNSVARMAANGVFGVGTEDTPIFGGYVKEDKKGKRSASNGGKLKKKRGLTI